MINYLISNGHEKQVIPRVNILLVEKKNTYCSSLLTYVFKSIQGARMYFQNLLTKLLVQEQSVCPLRR